MTDDELSVRIARAVNSLCLEFGGDDKAKAMNAMANICFFTIQSMSLNVGIERTITTVEDMLAQATHDALSPSDEELGA